jgi:uncharacterized protein (UPF0332 family)
MTRTKPQQLDPKQVRLFLADAEKKAVAARKNLSIDFETAYQTAYQSMLKASLALMLSHGQRPRVQLGHHVAIIEFAQKHLDPGLVATFALFDRMRRKRNEAFYDIALIGEEEAEDAVSAAEAYLKVVSADILTRIQ